MGIAEPSVQSKSLTVSMQALSQAAAHLTPPQHCSASETGTSASHVQLLISPLWCSIAATLTENATRTLFAVLIVIF